MKATRGIINVAFLSVLASFANGQTITFEPDAKGCLPDGTIAADDIAISNQFLRSGVIFGLDSDMNGIPDTNSFPYLEEVGGDGTDGFGVGYPNILWDYASNGTSNQLGQYFLRTLDVSGAHGTEVLLISYVTPVTKASGEIWDLDSDMTRSWMHEQWCIEALDNNSQVITNLLTPVGPHYSGPDSLDGMPWPFEIKTGESNKISALRFVFVGTKTNSIGLAFNNFSPVDGQGTTNIIGVAKIAAAVEIYWHSQLGKTYQLQWTQGLGEQWHNLGAPLEGTGIEMSTTDTSRGADNSRRMYRVLETD
jgi:hypothetical protein